MKVTYPRLKRTAFWAWIIGTVSFGVILALKLYLSDDVTTQQEYKFFPVIIIFSTIFPALISWGLIMIIGLVTKDIYKSYDQVISQSRQELYYFLIPFGLSLLLLLFVFFFIYQGISVFGLPYLIAACITYYILFKKEVPLKECE